MQKSADAVLFQSMSLVTIFVAVLCNTVLGLFLLPRLAMSNHGRVFVRGWYWFNQHAAMYGWVPLAIGLLVWDYFRCGKKPGRRFKGWFTRKLLTFLAGGGRSAADCPGGFRRASLRRNSSI